MSAHRPIHPDTILAAVRDSRFGTRMPGFCTNCGEEHQSVEPDARRYPCEGGCGNTVYGAEELLIMGRADPISG